MPTIESESVDAIIADWPYGVTACKWDSVIPLEPLWRECKRVIKPKGAIALTAASPFNYILWASNVEWYKYELIWEKGNGTNFHSVNREPMRCHENVLIFGNSNITYNPQKTSEPSNRIRAITRRQNYESDTRGVYGSTQRNSGVYDHSRYPRSIIGKFSSLRNNQFITRYSLHPTQKPVALMEYLIKTYTNPGDLVLDNTMGSGSTGEACLRTGRRFIGIEIMEEYYNIAKARLDKVDREVKGEQLTLEEFV